MKTSISLLLAGIIALSANSCELFEPGLCLDKTRREAMDPHWDGQSGDSPKDSIIPAEPDTTFYYAAVDFPEDYDWVKDVSGGSSTAEITFFRNSEPLFSIPSGKSSLISNDPDTHHILEGHLFTEYSTISETVVKRDGNELFRYAGREFLKGLVVEEEDVWTLGQDRSGSGFSLRRNGEAVIAKREGTVFGDFTLRPQGALYRDGGELCFCYCRPFNGVQQFFSVKGPNEYEQNVGCNDVIDMLVCNGNCNFLISGRESDHPSILCGKAEVPVMKGFSGQISEGYLFCGTNGIGASGFFKGYVSEAPFITDNGESSMLDKCGNFYIYPCKDGIGSVSLNRDMMKISFPDGTEYSPAGRFLFFGRSCATVAGNRMITALNYAEPGRGPELAIGGETRKINVNGYISCIGK